MGKRILYACQRCGEEVSEGEEDHGGRHAYCGGELDVIGDFDDEDEDKTEWQKVQVNPPPMGLDSLILRRDIRERVSAYYDFIWRLGILGGRYPNIPPETIQRACEEWAAATHQHPHEVAQLALAGDPEWFVWLLFAS